MRRFVILAMLSVAALDAETVSRPKHKRLHWLRRIGSAEVSLAERVSSIRLRGEQAAPVNSRTAALRAR